MSKGEKTAALDDSKTQSTSKKEKSSKKVRLHLKSGDHSTTEALDPSIPGYMESPKPKGKEKSGERIGSAKSGGLSGIAASADPDFRENGRSKTKEKEKQPSRRKVSACKSSDLSGMASVLSNPVGTEGNEKSAPSSAKPDKTAGTSSKPKEKSGRGRLTSSKSSSLSSMAAAVEQSNPADPESSDKPKEKSGRRRLSSSKSGGLSSLAEAVEQSNPADPESIDKPKEKSGRRRLSSSKSGGLSSLAEAVAPSSPAGPESNDKPKEKSGRRRLSSSKSSGLSSLAEAVDPSNPADPESCDKPKEKSGRRRLSSSKSSGLSPMAAAVEPSNPADPESSDKVRTRRGISRGDSKAVNSNRSRSSERNPEESFESLVKHGRGRKRVDKERGEGGRSRSLSIDVRLRAAGRRGVAPTKSSENLAGFLNNENSIRERARTFQESQKSGASVTHGGFETSVNLDGMSQRSRTFDGNLSGSDAFLSMAMQAFQIGSNKVEQEDQQASLNALIYKLQDTSLEEELVGLFRRIKDAQGFPAQRKAGIGTNHITDVLCQALRNDPKCTDVEIDDSIRFQEVESSLPIEFAEGLHANVHVRSLIMQGLSLGDEILAAIGSSIQQNFTLQTLALADNAFTSDGLLSFCWFLGVNESLLSVDLSNQRNGARLLEEHEKDASQALSNNKTCRILRIDVTTRKCKKVIELLEERNTKANKTIDYERMLITYYRAEAARAENLYQLNLLEEKFKHGIKKEWTMLCNLAGIAKINKTERLGGLNPVVVPDSSSTEVKNMLPSEADMSPDGLFLDSEFIGKFFEPDPSSFGTIFNFRGQSALFRKFCSSHKLRDVIATKFVDILIDYKKTKDITQIVMADSYCGDSFVVALCKKCLGNPKLLPKLFLLDLSNNVISDAGVTALSECIADKQTMRYLQVVRLHDQFSAKTGRKVSFGPESEYNLTKALCQNVSVLCLSAKIEGIRERNKISTFLARNTELLEQARMMRRDSAGSGNDVLKVPRNDIEQQIDRIALNDPTVWSFDASGNQIFLSLKGKDIRKLVRGLANNKFLTEVLMDQLDLEDDFAFLLGESLATNSAIRVLSLEGNALTAKGVKAILEGISKNETLIELRLGGQSSKMTSIDEVGLIPALGDNSTIRVLSLDINGENVRQELHKRLALNLASKPHRGSLPGASRRDSDPGVRFCL